VKQRATVDFFFKGMLIGRLLLSLPKHRMVSSTGSSATQYHSDCNKTVTVDGHQITIPFTPGEDEPTWANAWRQAVLDVSLSSFFFFVVYRHFCIRSGQSIIIDVMRRAI
jgi:hypothetical protein